MEKTVPKIGGWLIIFAIQMVALFLLFLTMSYSLINRALLYEEADPMNTSMFSWEEANDWFVSVYFPLTIDIVFLVIYGILLFLFFNKNKEFPKAYFYLNLIVVAYLNALEFYSAMMGQVIYFIGTLVSLGWVIFWSIYLLRSKRVKQTFIHTIKRKRYVKLTEEEYELLKKNKDLI